MVETGCLSALGAEVDCSTRCAAKNVNNASCVLLASQEERRRVPEFSYTAQNETERLLLESHLPPSSARGYNGVSEVLLLGKWLMCQASSTSPKTAGVDVLKETLSTFVASFDILDATDDQLYGFRRILTDAVSLKGELVVPVLVALVEKLRSVSSPKSDTVDAVCRSPRYVQLGAFKCASLADARRRCQLIVHESEENVDLQENDHDFVLEVLKHHPQAVEKMTAMVRRAFTSGCTPFTKVVLFLFEKRQLCDLRGSGRIVSFDGLCGHCVYLWRFGCPLEHGQDEGFSYVRALMGVPDTIDIVYDVVCECLYDVVSLFPRCSSDLAELLAQKYPKLRVPVDEQLVYLKGCLYLAQRIPTIRQSILKTVLSNLTAMDVEIKGIGSEYIDPEWFTEWKENQLHLLAAELQKGTVSPDTVKRILAQSDWFETLYRKVRTEEEVDAMAYRLDIMIAYLLTWTEAELRVAEASPAPPHIVSSSSLLMVSSAEDEDDSSATCCSDTEGITIPSERCSSAASSLTMADVIVADILGIFRSVVLPTQQCRFVQFYFFHVVSMKVQWAEKLLQVLFGLLFDPDAVLSLRRVCAGYITSYVSRADYLPVKFVSSSLKYLSQFLTEFLQFWDRRDHLHDAKHMPSSPHAATMSPRREAHQRLLTNKAQLNPQSRVTLFYAVFQGICYILCFRADTLRWESSERLHKAQDKVDVAELLCDAPSPEEFTWLTSALKTFICSDLAPLVQCSHEVMVEFSKLCRRLHFLPELNAKFDHVLDSAKPSEHSECNFDAALRNPLPLPFDPYTLRQSSSFISGLYRRWADVQLLVPASTKLAEHVKSYVCAPRASPAVQPGMAVTHGILTDIVLPSEKGSLGDSLPAQSLVHQTQTAENELSVKHSSAPSPQLDSVCKTSVVATETSVTATTCSAVHPFALEGRSTSLTDQSEDSTKGKTDAGETLPNCTLDNVHSLSEAKKVANETEKFDQTFSVESAVPEVIMHCHQSFSCSGEVDQVNCNDSLPSTVLRSSRTSSPMAARSLNPSDVTGRVSGCLSNANHDTFESATTQLRSSPRPLRDDASYCSSSTVTSTICGERLLLSNVKDDSQPDAVHQDHTSPMRVNCPSAYLSEIPDLLRQPQLPTPATLTSPAAAESITIPATTFNALLSTLLAVTTPSVLAAQSAASSQAPASCVHHQQQLHNSSCVPPSTEVSKLSQPTFVSQNSAAASPARSAIRDRKSTGAYSNQALPPYSETAQPAPICVSTPLLPSLSATDDLSLDHLEIKATPRSKREKATDNESPGLSARLSLSRSTSCCQLFSSTPSQTSSQEPDIQVPRRRHFSRTTTSELASTMLLSSSSSSQQNKNGRSVPLMNGSQSAKHKEIELKPLEKSSFSRTVSPMSSVVVKKEPPRLLLPDAGSACTGRDRLTKRRMASRTVSEMRRYGSAPPLQTLHSQFLTTPILDLSEELPNEKDHLYSFKDAHNHRFQDAWNASAKQRRFSLNLQDQGYDATGPEHHESGNPLHSDITHDALFESHEFSFRPKAAPFREEQVLEELEPFLEWDASGFTSTVTNVDVELSGVASQRRQCVPTASRMSELLSSRAYRVSLGTTLGHGTGSFGRRHSRLHVASRKKKKRLGERKSLDDTLTATKAETFDAVTHQAEHDALPKLCTSLSEGRSLSKDNFELLPKKKHRSSKRSDSCSAVDRKNAFQSQSHNDVLEPSSAFLVPRCSPVLGKRSSASSPLRKQRRSSVCSSIALGVPLTVSPSMPVTRHNAVASSSQTNVQSVESQSLAVQTPSSHNSCSTTVSAVKPQQQQHMASQNVVVHDAGGHSRKIKKLKRTKHVDSAPKDSSSLSYAMPAAQDHKTEDSSVPRVSIPPDYTVSVADQHRSESVGLDTSQRRHKGKRKAVTPLGEEETFLSRSHAAFSVEYDSPQRFTRERKKRRKKVEDPV